jgi:uncharacterized C2H2 Zn-finger protein
MCHQCKKTFKNTTKLYKHILNRGEARLSCSQCNKLFKRLTERKVHVRESHSIKMGVEF